MAHIRILLGSLASLALAVAFGNCSGGFSAETNLSVAGDQFCSDNVQDEVCNQPQGTLDCSFNGAVVDEGSSVTAYLNSTAPSGGACQPQVRNCNAGILSGSYAFASCSTTGPRSCLFNGRTIAHGESVLAYLTSSSADCQGQTRVCNDGSLSGSYAFASCSSQATAACLFDGSITVLHGSSVVAYDASNVPFGGQCVPKTRTCLNGSLSGTGNFASCVVNGPQSCLFNGQTVPHGAGVQGYFSSNVPFGQACASETRLCQNGTLSGSAQYGACEVNAPAACLINGRTIPHGGSTTMFHRNVMRSRQETCDAAEVRSCVNGVLSGSAPHDSCHRVEFYSGVVHSGYHQMIPGTHNSQPHTLYAPDVYSDFLLMGGWLTAADVGPDKLYISRFIPGSDWGPLAELKWNNSGYSEGRVPNHSANDPSVLARPADGMLMMYFTVLNSAYAYDTKEMTARNWVNVAESNNNGQSWTNRDGTLIGQYNGLDHTGAWAPAATLGHDGGVALFYHTGSADCPSNVCNHSLPKAPRLLRTKFDNWGLNAISTVEAKDLYGRSLILVNVDAKIKDGKYWLVGQTADQKQILLYFSYDGISFWHFNLERGGVLIDTRASETDARVITPHITFVGPTSINLLFNFQQTPSHPWTTHVWRFDLQSRDQ